MKKSIYSNITHTLIEDRQMNQLTFLANALYFNRKPERYKKIFNIVKDEWKDNPAFLLKDQKIPLEMINMLNDVEVLWDELKTLEKIRDKLLESNNLYHYHMGLCLKNEISYQECCNNNKDMNGKKI